MDIMEALDEIDALINRLKAPIPSDEAKEEWNALQSTLDALVTEAERLRLPSGMVSQYAARLRQHAGALLGLVADDGHPRDQHWVWACGDMQAMRGSHAFGPALDRLAESPSGSVH